MGVRTWARLCKAKSYDDYDTRTRKVQPTSFKRRTIIAKEKSPMIETIVRWFVPVDGSGKTFVHPFATSRGIRPQVGDSVSIEHLIERKQGMYKVVWVGFTFVKDESGNPVTFFDVIIE